MIHYLRVLRVWQKATRVLSASARPKLKRHPLETVESLPIGVGLGSANERCEFAPVPPIGYARFAHRPVCAFFNFVDWPRDHRRRGRKPHNLLVPYSLGNDRQCHLQPCRKRTKGRKWPIRMRLPNSLPQKSRSWSRMLLVRRTKKRKSVRDLPLGFGSANEIFVDVVFFSGVEDRY